MKSIQLPNTGTGNRGTRRRGQGGQDRRGAVVAQVAICLTALVGFMALSIDVGHMYNLRADLQRSAAAKVLILLTDGIANQTRSNPTSYSTCQARIDARTAAAEARAQGVRIDAIRVGGNADQELMKQTADGNYPTPEPNMPYEVDDHFHAEGSVASYQQQLQNIFKKLGGERPIMLIE